MGVSRVSFLLCIMFFYQSFVCVVCVRGGVWFTFENLVTLQQTPCHLRSPFWNVVLFCWVVCASVPCNSNQTMVVRVSVCIFHGIWEPTLHTPRFGPGSGDHLYIQSWSCTIWSLIRAMPSTKLALPVKCSIIWAFLKKKKKSTSFY